MRAVEARSGSQGAAAAGMAGVAGTTRSHRSRCHRAATTPARAGPACPRWRLSCTAESPHHHNWRRCSVSAGLSLADSIAALAVKAGSDPARRSHDSRSYCRERELGEDAAHVLRRLEESATGTMTDQEKREVRHLIDAHERTLAICRACAETTRDLPGKSGAAACRPPRRSTKRRPKPNAGWSSSARLRSRLPK